MLDQLISFFTSETSLLGAGIISAVVSAAVSYYFRKKETSHRVKTEYEYEQRKELRNLIGRYHGRLLNASNSLNYRMFNLYRNHSEGWLDVDGNYSEEAYYYNSFVYRFLRVIALVRQFQREAIYLDGRIAQDSDFTFIKYNELIMWSMTDTSLFDGLKYNTFDQTDHFFSDILRRYCDFLIKEEKKLIKFDNFVSIIQKNNDIEPVLEYFDGLSKDEDRLRWDRLIVLHLLLTAFINKFGYDHHSISRKKQRKIAS